MIQDRTGAVLMYKLHAEHSKHTANVRILNKHLQ